MLKSQSSKSYLQSIPVTSKTMTLISGSLEPGGEMLWTQQKKKVACFFLGYIQCCSLMCRICKIIAAGVKKIEKFGMFSDAHLHWIRHRASAACEVAKEVRRVNTEAEQMRAWRAAATYRRSPEEHQRWSPETIQSRLWWLERFFLLTAIFLQCNNGSRRTDVHR